MMRTTLLLLSIAIAAATMTATATPATGQATPIPSATPRNGSLIGEYCVGCHNDRVKRGDLVLSHLDDTRVALTPQPGKR